MGKDREIQLDVVRGFAILLAMGFHLNAYGANRAFNALMFPAHEAGWAGVDLFFVLSGFLVGRMILKEIRDNGAFDYNRFFIRRIFRLWPVLYVYILAQLFIGNHPWNTYFFQVLFHVQNYFQTPIAHLWSLAVEEHFYLAAGLVLPWLARRNAGPATYVKGLLAILAISFVLRCIGVAMHLGLDALMGQTQFRADALACGVLLAVVSLHYPVLFERLLRPRLLWLVLALCGFASLTTMGLTGWMQTIGFTVAYLSSAAFMLALYRQPIAPPLLPVARVFAFLGLYAYTLYIWHYSIGHVVQTKVTALTGWSDPMVLVPVEYAAAIAGAFVVTQALEWPMMRLRDRLFPSMTSPAAAVAAPPADVRDKLAS